MTALDLSGFHGSETFVRHPLNPHILLTEGARYVADKAGAWWLMDKIATLQALPDIRRHDFQTWELSVDDKERAILSCRDGRGSFYAEKIRWTDFPPPGVTLWCVGGVVMLPSEY